MRNFINPIWRRDSWRYDGISVISLYMGVRPISHFFSQHMPLNNLCFSFLQHEPNTDETLYLQTPCDEPHMRGWTFLVIFGPPVRASWFIFFWYSLTNIRHSISGIYFVPNNVFCMKRYCGIVGLILSQNIWGMFLYDKTFYKTNKTELYTDPSNHVTHIL